MHVQKRTFFSSSLLYPKMSSLFCASSELRPSFVHLRHSKTSSTGMFSCQKQNWVSNRPDAICTIPTNILYLQSYITHNNHTTIDHQHKKKKSTRSIVSWLIASSEVAGFSIVAVLWLSVSVVPISTKIYNLYNTKSNYHKKSL